MQVPSILQGESRTRLLQGIAIGAVASMELGTGRLRGEGRLDGTAGGCLARLSLGQGVCREARPSQNSSSMS